MMQATFPSQLGVDQSLEVQNRPVHVERIDPTVLQFICFLFPCQFEGMNFLALLCRRATEKQQAFSREPVAAVLTFHGIAALCDSPDWPWGYHATLRYFIIFEALGVLTRARRNRITEVLIPLGIREEPLTREHLLESLEDLQKKNPKKREYKDKKLLQLIERVKKHIEVYGLGASGDSEQGWVNPFDSAPLLTAQERMIEVMRSERIPLAKCQRIAQWMCANQVPQLLRDYLLAEGRLVEHQGDSEEAAREGSVRYQCKLDASHVEDLPTDRLQRGDSEEATGDSQEDTDQSLTAQNRPNSEPQTVSSVTTMPTSGPKPVISALDEAVDEEVGDSKQRIDSDITSHSNISQRGRDDIEGTPPSQFAFQPNDYQRFNSRAAHDLARDVEQRPEAFRAYIDLSKRCSQTAIRAGVINMLVHTYFPDETGDMSAEQDGVLTNAWGRPENPGKWVFSHSRAYGAQGIPEVMRVLLTRYEGFSYQDIERDLKALERHGLKPPQFWAKVQVEVACVDAEKLPDTQPNALITEEQTSLARGGVLSRDALAIVERINREGYAYGITAQVRPQPGNRFEVEMMQQVNGKVVPILREIRCEDDWATYVALLEEVQALY